MGNTSSTAQSTLDRSAAGADGGQHVEKHEYQPSQDFLQYLKEYARARPDVAALWCFGIGFVLGWKLKPW